MARIVNRRSPRRAYTLIEMLVVVVVLAALAALSWPTVRTTFEKSQLRDAARRLSIELTKARLAAIESGEVRQFRFQPGGTRFETGPRIVTQDLASIINPYDNQPTNVVADDLPGGVMFAPPEQMAEMAQADESASPAAAAQAVAEAAGGEQSDSDDAYDAADWGPPIIFQPNGRSTNAHLRLIGARNLYLELTLRGLTGTVRIGQVLQGEASP